MHNKIISIIPARSGSKGLKNKNIRLLSGRPLIDWSILFAKKCSLIDDCIVSTDSQEIADIALASGAKVPYLRSKELSTDIARTSDVLIDVIKNCNIRNDDIILLLEPTSPYRKFSDFQKIVELMENNNLRKVVSVSEAVSSSYRFQFFQSNSKNKEISPISKEAFPTDLRRQDIQKTYFIDGSFYTSFVSDFLEKPGFIGEETGSIVGNLFSSFEIDAEDDMKLMEAIFQYIGYPFDI